MQAKKALKLRTSKFARQGPPGPGSLAAASYRLCPLFLVLFVFLFHERGERIKSSPKLEARSEPTKKHQGKRSRKSSSRLYLARSLCSEETPLHSSVHLNATCSCSTYLVVQGDQATHYLVPANHLLSPFSASWAARGEPHVARSPKLTGALNSRK